ncbi:DNA (cytosine-5-)-methyltransferase [Mesomycoplasma ovipneumoniae]|uniref:DNA (cytosine-5-)-methyltransferase n=1 Tax=Mesomycoplasma ovipneumoniae TaxID=29562 RepID=UPI003080563D
MSKNNKNNYYPWYSDIHQVNQIPKNIDIFTYSFPCQDLSTQGLQKGLNPSTRSGLLWQIKRILENNLDNLPKVLLLENVKNLASQKFRAEFNNWINFLKTLGYKSKWKILNSTDFGSSQNRQRVFMVSWLTNKKFEWPTPIKHNNNLKKILDFTHLPNEENLASKIFKYQLTSPRITNSRIKKKEIINFTKFNSENYIYYPDFFGPTLTASGANSRLKFLFQENYIREINFYESFKYMGFTAHDAHKIYKTNLVQPKSIIFLAGNSISIEVLKALFEKIVLLLEKE